MKLRPISRNISTSLSAILDEDDDLGLLAGVVPVRKRQEVVKDQSVSVFLEIVDFYEKHRRVPDENIPEEKVLAWQLKGYLIRPKQREKVLEYDRFGLLSEVVTSTVPVESPAEKKTVREVVSLDDIFDDDDLGLLGGIDTSIHNVRHVSSPAVKEIPDEIASRKPCEDFYRYEKFFKDIQRILHSKAVMLERFSSESEASVGQVFILRGQLCYVDRVLKEDTPDSKRDNPRLRVIFENGTEADLLKRSLARALYKDDHSRRINFDPNLFSEHSITISHGDQPTGYIYILASETTAPTLASLKAAGKLVKIGYSNQDVHERIKNAHTDPTYLEAPVRLLAKIDCYNLNPQKFENLIHAFLYQQKLNITLVSASGKPYRPKEWFSVCVETAVEICNRIIDGTIVKYRMDNTAGTIVKKR